MIKLLKLLILCAFAVACKQETNPLPALSTTGELMDDGRGECGVVPIDETHAITAAHCVNGYNKVYYHAPNTFEGRRVEHINLVEEYDVACLTVKTDSTGVTVAEMFAEQDVELRGNMSDTQRGKTTTRTHGEIVVAELSSQQGDSGSGIFNMNGEVVGLLSVGYHAENDKAELVGLARAELAKTLCE